VPHPKDKEDFVDQVKWLKNYLSELPPPKYPFPINTAKAAAGKPLFDTHCAGCHASDKTGTPLRLADVGTDRGRLDSWNKGAAIKANQVVKEMGLERKWAGRGRPDTATSLPSSTASG
jgi:mono/diheme cytochrome c family protein